MVDYKLLNGTTLAYIGDSYYDLMIRKHLIDQEMTKVSELHKQSTKYVSSIAQASIINEWMTGDFLSQEEKDIVKRGRNSKINHSRQNVDILTYKHATSFESLIGYLYLTKQFERLDTIINQAIKLIEKW
jgi:ribonuclease III family protein